jgi:uncharacterized protein (TIGR02246 family)
MASISRILVVLLAASALLLNTGCKDRHKEVAKEIDAVNQQVAAALAAGDSAAIAALYTEDAQLLPPGSPVVSGRAAIGGFWQGAITSGVKGISLKTNEIRGKRKAAYEVGEYRLTGAGGKELEVGKYIVVWKRIEGQWRLHRDIWNSNKNP